MKNNDRQLKVMICLIFLSVRLLQGIDSKIGCKWNHSEITIIFIVQFRHSVAARIQQLSQ